MTKTSILIVEDELIVAYNLSEFLKRNNYTVVGIANSGKKALKMFDRYQPDIILMDILLVGNLTGIETAHKIRETSDVTIIYQTAFSDSKTKQQAQLPNNCFYITKPVQFTDLLETLKQAEEAIK